MGLTHSSTGRGAADEGLVIRKRAPGDRVVALAGNPNVGKSTLFNALTNMDQHTGNWAGKTVASAQGYCRRGERGYVLVDLPGTYSLMAHSPEEEVARNFLCFGPCDAVVVVCDATALERNLNLVLQTLELTTRVVVCVNLMDEARRKGIHIDLEALERRLGVPVVGTVARKKKSLDAVLAAVDAVAQAPATPAPQLRYPQRVEAAIGVLSPVVEPLCGGRLNPRWLSLKLLEGDAALLREASRFLGRDLLGDNQLARAVAEQQEELKRWGFDADRLRDCMVSAIVGAAEALSRAVVKRRESGGRDLDRRIDRVLTSRRTGYPVMVALLALVLWLSIVGANYPSQLLSTALFWVEDRLSELFVALGAPGWLRSLVVQGGYRVLAWVVSVMLPPMAIFFPLFTLLEDAGYLPRVAYNLDKPFCRCKACGKQALTLCMGFGCNAAGVVGCRIIDSPRERLLAILTNNFVPCNGRFPTLITLFAIFFAAGLGRWWGSVVSAALLTGVVVLGVVITLTVTRALSETVLKGTPSAFTLELPPYRKPQVGRVLASSIVDRTLFVLGRAAAVAAPAGLAIWLLANVTVGESTLLSLCAGALEPLGRAMGMDGVILLAFVLGFPANEIVIPIMLMTYLAQGTLTPTGSVQEIGAVLIQAGWTWHTAVSVVLFSLLHWPCSTTLWTIYKETRSGKWTLLAAALPTAVGVVVCTAFTLVVRVLGV